MVMNSPVYDTATPMFGIGSLAGGSGQATVTLPAGGNMTFEAFVRLTATPSAATDLIKITDASGNSVSVSCDGSDGYFNIHYLSSTGTPDYTGYTNFPLNTGISHIALVWDWEQEQNFHLYFNGAVARDYNGDRVNPIAGPLTVKAQVPNASVTLDSLRVSAGARYGGAFSPPSGPLARDGYTLGLWHFDGSGAGS